MAGENMTESLSLDELTASGLLLVDNGKPMEEQENLETILAMSGSATFPLKMFPAAHELPHRHHHQPMNATSPIIMVLMLAKNTTINTFSDMRMDSVSSG